MKVSWTAAAAQDRADICAHIAKESPQAAIRVDTVFDQAAARLAQFPRLGRLGRVSGTRELIPHRSYRLVYEIYGETVVILRVLHTARLWPPSTE